jgi:hypothetical protein
VNTSLPSSAPIPAEDATCSFLPRGTLLKQCNGEGTENRNSWFFGWLG